MKSGSNLCLTKKKTEVIEIIIDPASNEFVLSLLNEKEREFFENFVGAFVPASDFIEDDLITD